LSCVSDIGKPTVADGRDLLKETVDWTDTLMLHQWLPGLTELIAKIKGQDASSLGTFPLGYPCLLSTWARPGMQVFEATELDSQSKRYSRPRRLVLTHSFLLFLDPVSKDPSIAHIVGFACFASLSSVRQVKSESDKLVFTFRQTSDEPAFSQTFKIKHEHEFLELLATNMRAIGITPKRQQAELIIREDEVTAKSLQTVNVRELLQTIAVREIELGSSLTVPCINELMSLYQRAIEYYSGIGDSQFEVYLRRMHAFLNDPLVLATLRGEAHTLLEETKGDADYQDVADQRLAEVEHVQEAAEGQGHDQAADQHLVEVPEVSLVAGPEVIKVLENEEEKQDLEGIQVTEASSADREEDKQGETPQDTALGLATPDFEAGETADVEKSKDTHTAVVEESKETHEDAIEESKETYKAVIEESKDTHEAVIEESKDTHEAVIEESKDTHAEPDVKADTSLSPTEVSEQIVESPDIEPEVEEEKLQQTDQVPQSTEELPPNEEIAPQETESVAEDEPPQEDSAEEQGVAVQPKAEGGEPLASE
jgi:phage pi2 protein 07